MITNEEILQKSQELNKLILQKWLNQEFLSYQWFFIVILVIVAYIIFFYLADKKRITEISAEQSLSKLLAHSNRKSYNPKK